MAKYKTFGRPEAVWNKHGGEEGIDRFLSGETMVVEKSPHILFVDRSIKPMYPEPGCGPLHYYLEAKGPEHYDPSSLLLYSHPKQDTNGFDGHHFHGWLKETELIKLCTSLRDGEELKKNPSCYPELWKAKRVFLWKSVMQEGKHKFSVPYVCWEGGTVCIGWEKFDCRWRSDYAVPFFAS